jgi:hypothetical protein
MLWSKLNIVLVLSVAAIWTLAPSSQAPAEQGQATKRVREATSCPSQDAALAINNPDEFAWRLFLSMCRQALPNMAGAPDAVKPTLKDFDPDRSVVWETWALSSAGRINGFYPRVNRSEVFKDRGVKPVPWDELPRREQLPKVFEAFPAKGVEALIQASQNAGLKLDPSLPGDNGVEVRMNRAAYEHIRDNNLYTIEGLEEKLRKKQKIALPMAAREIKALWVKINEKEKPCYHWRTRMSGKKKELWGPAALHIATRDLPNWFWCDFEHIDYECRAEIESPDSTTRGEHPPAGTNGVREETRGSKWQYYRLRGTQVDFTDSYGRPVILSNTLLERGFQQTSSCMTCHARASVALRSQRARASGWQANHLPDFTTISPALVGPLGSPNPSWFLDEDLQPRYVQTDFIGSLSFRALSTKVDPPTP